MITIQSAESALKNIFLESAINDINTKTNPFLTMIQKNAKTVAGNEARATVRYGNENSVIVGDEGGTLPKVDGKSVEIVTPLKNLYGSFQISDKAIKASQNSAGAFASLLSQEMQNLVGTAQYNLNSLVYGNGMKLITIIDGYDKSNKQFTLQEKDRGRFAVGDKIRIWTVNNEPIHPQADYVLISNVNGLVHTVQGTTSVFNDYDRYYIYSYSDDDTTFNGVDSIFRQDKIYNLAKSENTAIAPCIVKSTDVATNLSALNEDKILDFLQKYEEHCECNPADVMLMHPLVRRAVQEQVKTLRSNIDLHDFKCGYSGFTFNGLPVYTDMKCKTGSAYALNSDSWSMHQLCDWTWLAGEDGNVLKQIDGKAGYSATIVKYADLLCNKPFFQGKVTGYSSRKIA